MNIQAEKLEIMKIVLETNDPGILNSIKRPFKHESQIDFWNTLTTWQKEEILQGIFEIEQGDSVAYEDIIKKYHD